MTDKTIVLNIDIQDNGNRNEFSYIDLVECQLGLKSNSNGIGDQDSRLVELAKSFERKYGQMVTIKNKGQKRRLRVDDFIDYGEGYDSQDSFIDDSEAVELVVAPTLSTRHGGFFVNEGFLESIEDKSMNIELSPSAQKHHKDEHTSSAVSKRPKIKKDKSKLLLEKAVKQLVTPAVQTNSKANKNELSSLDAVFDSVLSATTVPTKAVQPPTLSETISKNNGILPKPSPVSKAHQGPMTLPPLPDSLLSEVKKLISFKPTAQVSSKTPLPPQFDKELLRFDGLLANNNTLKMTKSAIYAHIADELGMKRKPLMTKLRKLKELNEDSMLEPIIIALKDAVSNVMPDIISAYNRDMIGYQDRLNTWETERLSNPELKRPGAPKKIFRWNKDCRILIERIVTFRMESVFNATGKCCDEEHMKRFLNTLIALWPDNWISAASLWRAGLPIYQNLLKKFSPAAPNILPPTVPAIHGSSKPITKPVPTTTANKPPLLKPNDVNPSSSGSHVPQLSHQTKTTPSSLPSSTPSNICYTTPSIRHQISPRQILASGQNNSTISSKEGQYVLQLAAPTKGVSAPSQAIPGQVIDLTESWAVSPPRQPLPAISSFSPPSIISPPMAARRLNPDIQGSFSIAGVLPNSTPSVRLPASAVQNSAVTASQPNLTDSTAITLHAVSNLISAFHQQRMQHQQNQQPAVASNARYTLTSLNRPQQQTQCPVGSMSTPVASQKFNSYATPNTYGQNVSPVRQLPPQQQPQLASPQVGAPNRPQTFVDLTQLSQQYHHWQQHYSTTLDTSNATHQSADRTGN